MKLRHFVSISDLSSKEIVKVLDLADKLKRELKTKGKNKKILDGKTLVMIYEKPSLRTRLSFEIGMTQLGGHAIYLGPTDISMGKRESVTDIAKVTSRMADIIMARTFSHKIVEELAKNSSVPVINGLSDMEHPCQILADLMTIREVKKKLKGLNISYVGDCENNVVHSFALACQILEMKFKCAAPKGYEMNKKILAKSKAIQLTDPIKAVKNADVVITDTWISMGDEAEKEKRLKIFKPYQVNKKLMKEAKNNAIFLHCLPAYRGNEVTSEIIDGNKSFVFQEAENRLHAQKALIIFLLNARFRK
ncbi:MAG: ornithine carbamoyltransferase [Candidatus Woesebacteria bacterium]|nr:MAG: ornithine carbamoyltransferase [Candidatus Woesebacteria bacterium]